MSILHQTTFTLFSKTMSGQATQAMIYSEAGGENKSPQLYWTNAPADTKSFAITMFDPDAPTYSGFWHWTIFDIPAHITELPENAGNIALGLAPNGAIQSLNDYGIKGYGGPCPPIGHGFHQYIITVHALNIEKLGLSENINPAKVGFNLWDKLIAKASIVTYHKR